MTCCRGEDSRSGGSSDFFSELGVTLRSENRVGIPVKLTYLVGLKESQVQFIYVLNLFRKFISFKVIIQSTGRLVSPIILCVGFHDLALTKAFGFFLFLI